MVNPVEPLDERALRAKLERVRARLDELARQLGAIDGELEALSGDRHRHRLLDEVCGGLEKLGELGGAALFWGEQAGEAVAADRIRFARGHVDAFQKRLDEIDARRDALVDEIEEQEQHGWYLEGEILEAQEQEARRSQEWVVEREVEAFPVPALTMPWVRSGEDDQRFRRSVTLSVALSVLFALVVPYVDLPLPELAPATEAPERLTRLIMERREAPKPPPQRAMPEPKPSDRVVAEQEPPAKRKEGQGKGPGEGPATGPGKGLLAFREKLTNVTQNQALARLGAQAKLTGAAPSGVVERSMVAIQAPGSSGGINLSTLSRGVNGGGAGGAGSPAAVQIARATSTIAGGGGNGRASDGTGSGAAHGRTDEEIQIVFDRHKSALYRLYNRELRSDPALRGQMVLRIRIEPDGSVTLCELQGTDMEAPQLVAQVLERVKTFDFGAKDVPAVTILYPIDFLPAT
jgi:hypothetical protein